MLHAGHGLSLTRAIGEYLIDTFFGGDPSEFHRRGTGHASFGTLATHADLSASASTLWRLVAVVE